MMNIILLLFGLSFNFSTADTPTSLDLNPGEMVKIEAKVKELFRFYMDYPSGCSSVDDIVHCYYFNPTTEDGTKHYIVRGRYSYKCGSNSESTIFMLKLYQFNKEFYIWQAEYDCDFSRKQKGFENCGIYLSPKKGVKDKI